MKEFGYGLDQQIIIVKPGSMEICSENIMGGFLPIFFEITDFIKLDSNNELIIKVDNKLTSDTIPQGS